MPQKVIKFSGINRSVNEFQNSGACEELINLRQKAGGGHGVVKPKKQTEQNVRYEAFYEHKFGDTNNKIAIFNGMVKWLKEDGEQTKITDEYYGKHVSISHVGNILVVYCEHDKKQSVFKFDKDKYSEYSINIKPISDIGLNYSGDVPYGASVDNNIEGNYNSALIKAASAFHNMYPNGLCGVAVIGCTYELEDGTEAWSTAFKVIDTTSDLTIEAQTGNVLVFGPDKVSVTVYTEGEASGIKSINVYASRYVFPYEISLNSDYTFNINKIPLDKLNLDGQLMYYQGSISAKDGAGTIYLRFGTEQSGENIMDVTSGCIERVGKVVSYNNRFHFYQSETNHIIQVPRVSFDRKEHLSYSHWIAYVEFDGKWKLIKNFHRLPDDGTCHFVYPMNGVKRMAFVRGELSILGEFVTPYEDMFYVDLKNSNAYNYSYAFDVTPSIISANDFYNEMLLSGQVWNNNFIQDRTILWKKEMNTINVSAKDNPFVFPVEHSYSFSGEILDVDTSYIPISSTQVSQYPLSIFTTDGIYALSQGDGSALYGGVVPLQPMVIEGKAKSTPHGVFFISNRNLYILSGRDSISLSSSLDGNRELSIRNTSSYKKLCCNGDGPFYDYTFALSNEDFEEFISGATLAYDEFRNELHISSGNPDKDYSYVLNLDTKTYHKVIGRYESQYKCSRYVIESKNGKRNLIDLFSEEKSDVPILLQSRPMSLEAFYTHIQRLILLADAKLDECQHLCLSVFGSDNLNDWKCIISSQKHNTILRHVRTNRSAKSYKDYVILITGVVDSDTDISDIIADYTVVNRRIG